MEIKGKIQKMEFLTCTFNTLKDREKIYYQ